MTTTIINTIRGLFVKQEDACEGDEYKPRYRRPKCEGECIYKQDLYAALRTPGKWVTPYCMRCRRRKYSKQEMEEFNAPGVVPLDPELIVSGTPTNV